MKSRGGSFCSVLLGSILLCSPPLNDDITARRPNKEPELHVTWSLGQSASCSSVVPLPVWFFSGSCSTNMTFCRLFLNKEHHEVKDLIENRWPWCWDASTKLFNYVTVDDWCIALNIGIIFPLVKEGPVYPMLKEIRKEALKHHKNDYSPSFVPMSLLLLFPGESQEVTPMLPVVMCYRGRAWSGTQQRAAVRSVQTAEPEYKIWASSLVSYDKIKCIKMTNND